MPNLSHRRVVESAAEVPSEFHDIEDLHQIVSEPRSHRVWSPELPRSNFSAYVFEFANRRESLVYRNPDPQRTADRQEHEDHHENA
ncbi:MAG TPA: hypothetical protein VGH74_22955 [Planctomycetaceae bacterium]